jgi:ADP-ribosylglycohydrolase
MNPSKESAIVGCLLGTAIGDAIGLPLERLSKERQHSLYGEINRHHFFFGKGMVSDDTEHACMTAQALIAAGADVEIFQKHLARQMKVWLLALPAGTGYATLRAVLKLLFGFSPEQSGVFSAGNGPAMRSPIIGVYCGNDKEKLRSLVRASTRLTHTDPKAEFGALAVALAAYRGSTLEIVSPEEFCRGLEELLGPDGNELLRLVEQAALSATAGQTTQDFAVQLGLAHGVSGYIYHTVPVVLHAWFRHPHDFQSAIIEIISCGGDTDSTAAILGGIIGARVGPDGIPSPWLDDLREWPRTVNWMRALGQQLESVRVQGVTEKPLSVPFATVVLRNLIFLAVVLGHALRRLLPPY